MTIIGGLNPFSTIKANLTITYSLLEREKDLKKCLKVMSFNSFVPPINFKVWISIVTMVNEQHADKANHYI